jgi:hypothetical protein
MSTEKIMPYDGTKQNRKLESDERNKANSCKPEARYRQDFGPRTPIDSTPLDSGSGKWATSARVKGDAILPSVISIML